MGRYGVYDCRGRERMDETQLHQKYAYYRNDGSDTRELFFSGFRLIYICYLGDNAMLFVGEGKENMENFIKENKE